MAGGPAGAASATRLRRDGTRPGRRRTRVPRSRQAAAAALAAVPVGTWVLLVVAGPGRYAAPESQRHLAMVTVAAAAAPAVALLVAGRHLPVPGSPGRRRAALLALALVVAGVAWWLWPYGGAVWLPAAALTAVAAVLPAPIAPPHHPTARPTGAAAQPPTPGPATQPPAPIAPSHDATARPVAAPGWVTAAAAVAVIGAVLHATTARQSPVATVAPVTLVASGLLLFGWAPLALSLAPGAPAAPRRLCALGGAGLLAAGLLVPAEVGARWFLPAAVLLVLAGVLPTPHPPAAPAPSPSPATGTGGVRQPTAAAVGPIGPIGPIVPVGPVGRTGGRPVRRLAQVVLVVLVAAGLPTGASRPAPTRLQLGPVEVADAEALLAEAEIDFLRTALADPELVVLPGARCYVLDDQPLLACGPVQRLDADPAWYTYAVASGSGGVEPREAQPTSGVDVARLSRPDGLRPPDPGDVAAAELLPRARPGSVMALAGDPGGDGRDVDGRVDVTGGQVAVTGLAAPATVTDEAGVERRAPDGHELLAARIEPDRGVAVTLEVVTEQGRVDASDLLGEPGALSATWLAAVVPTGGEVTLAVTDRGFTQELSLRTGERLPGTPPLVDDPHLHDLAHAVDAATVTVTAPVPVRHAVEARIGPYAVERAELVALDAGRGWAGPGRAWLVVTLDDLDNPVWIDIEERTEPLIRFDAPGSFRLSAGDQTVAPAAVQPTDGGGLAVVFDVRDDFTTGTFRSGPRWVLVFDDRAVDLAAPATAVEVDLG